MIEAIRKYLLTYPGLSEGNAALHVDFLGADGENYTIEPVPSDPVYRQYTDGGCLKQYLFVFASREYYSPDVAQCVENQAFYEDFGRWIREQNRAGILPDPGEHVRPVSIEVQTGGYVFSEDAETARDQMQLRYIYEEI